MQYGRSISTGIYHATVYKQYSEALQTDSYRFESERIGIASLMHAVFSLTSLLKPFLK